MAKFNKKKEGIKPTEVNQMGERAYKLSAKDELVSTVLTTFLNDSYYEKQKEVVSRILKAADDCEPLFVAKLAIYARTQANMRSVSHLLAAHLANRISGAAYAKHFYEQVIVRPDDMNEIISCYAHSQKQTKLRKLPNAMKKGFASRLGKLDPYTIDKYKMESRDLTLVDLVNLVHPRPTEKNTEAFRRLMKGESLAGLYESKVLEKELTKSGQSDDEYTKEDAIRSVLFGAHGMPILALLRNLRNILEKAPSCVDEACRQLTIEQKILKSRALPFRFATAYGEIEKLKGGMFEKDTKNIKQVLGALEKALNISIANIPKLKGNTAILIDHSGSVRGDSGGTSFISAFSKTSTAMIGNLSATMLAYSQDNVYIGLFGDKLIDVPIDRDLGALKFNTHSFNEGAKCGPRTENGLYIFFDKCVREHIKVDNLVIFSDMVIGSDGSGGWDYTSRAGLGTFQALFKAFKQINPACHTLCVDIRQTRGTSVFDQSLNVTNVAGWSDKIFDLLSTKSRGYAELIAEIERINIVGSTSEPALKSE